MRARPISSVFQEWEAVEAPIIAIVDQNLTANGRSYLEALFEEAIILEKKLAFEGESGFFNPYGNQELDKEAFYFDGSKEDKRRAFKKGSNRHQVGFGTAN